MNILDLTLLRKFTVPLLALLFIPSVVHAWRSSLYPANWVPPTTLNFETDKIIQDFSYAGYHTGDVAIPSLTGPIFNVTSYGADSNGVSDSTSAIQNAINAAEVAGGGVVLLPEGTYKLSVQAGTDYCLLIDQPGVVLRGEGSDKTFLLNTTTAMRQKKVIKVSGPNGASFYDGGSVTANITSNLLTPTTEIPVTNSSLFQVGDWVFIRNTITDAWANEHNEPGWVGQSAGLRGQSYPRKIVDIDAATNVLTVNIPTRYYLKTRDSARVVLPSAVPISEVGIENLALANVQHPGTGWGEDDYKVSSKAAYDVHGSYLIAFQRARNSWVQDVVSWLPTQNTTSCHMLSNGLQLFESYGMTIRDCHFQRCQYGGGGGNGYMYRLSRSSDCLIQDSKATFSRHGFVFSNMASSGNVIHRCVDKTTGKQTGNTGNQGTKGKGCDHHMHFSHSNLIDTCVGNNSFWEARYRPFGSTPKHNITSAHGTYWNMEGTGTSGGSIVRTEQARYGYVIGTRGPRSGIDLLNDTGGRLNPQDHTEGAGMGSTLEPFSLYEDQLLRRLGGGPGGPSNTTINGNGDITLGEDHSSYGGQDLSGTTTVITGGSSATLTGNNWKKFPLNYTVTPDTILEFTIDATDTGEIIGAGFDEDNDLLNNKRIFQVGGGQNWTDGYPVTPTYTAGSGPVTYSINVGDFYTGAMNWLVLSADDDANGSTNVTFSNLRVYEDTGNGGPGNDLTASADAHVRGGSNSASNYGDATELSVKDAGSASYNRIAYIKFDLSSLNADVSSATLVLTVSGVGSESATTRPVELRQVADDSWIEDSVTWNDKPAHGAILYSFDVTANDVGNEVAFDVTNYINTERTNDNTVTFALTQPANTDALVKFGSRESSTPMKLELTSTDSTGAIVEVDPYHASNWDFFQFRVSNISTSACITSIKLSITGGGGFDLFESSAAFSVAENLGGNNDGINPSMITINFTGSGLASSESAQNGINNNGLSDIDGTLSGISATVNFSDGSSKNGSMSNIGDSDDGDTDLYYISL